MEPIDTRQRYQGSTKLHGGQPLHPRPQTVQRSDTGLFPMCDAVVTPLGRGVILRGTGEIASSQRTAIAAPNAEFAQGGLSSENWKKERKIVRAMNR